MIVERTWPPVLQHLSTNALAVGESKSLLVVYRYIADKRLVLRATQRSSFPDLYRHVNLFCMVYVHTRSLDNART